MVIAQGIGNRNSALALSADFGNSRISLSGDGRFEPSFRASAGDGSI